MKYEDLKSGVYYYKYNEELYPFYNTVQSIFNIKSTPLELIHTIKSSPLDQVTFNTDTSTDFHKAYYSSPKYKDIINIYDAFIKDNILPLFNEDLVVQKEPSFRVCVPNNTALGRCDTDINTEIIGMHCDGDYNHPPEEINFMMTITGQENTNSCYIESQPNKADFFPVKLDRGEFMSFYGNKCRHYNKINLTGRTRISFDFRVIPYSRYKNNDSFSVHSNRKLCIGEYFKLLHI